LLAHEPIIFFHYIAGVEVVEQYALQGQVFLLHIFIGEHYAIDGAQSGICHQNTGQVEFADNIFQLDRFFIKIQGTGYAAAAFDDNIIMFLTDCLKGLLNYRHAYGIAFDTRGQVRGYGVFVYIGAHTFKALGNAGKFLDK